MNKVLLLFVFLVAFNSNAQVYPPAAGQSGSTAMYKDSSVFVNWANDCSIKRGYLDISNTALGFVSAGDSSMALGKAGTNGVVSLGDGGWAICSFPFPISNGPGFDFAVFENGFDDYFLELATIEVSSDGEHFFAFPSHSLTDTILQKGSFDSLDSKHLNHLAGKYRGNYGTPFDLEELQGNSNLNIQSITHVKVKDVVGSMANQFATRDAHGNKINEPWPTPFPSGGFDLDAIGVIHQNTFVGLNKTETDLQIGIFPNPIGTGEILTLRCSVGIESVRLIPSQGSTIALSFENLQLKLPELSAGVYILEIKSSLGIWHKKVVLEN